MAWYVHVRAWLASKPAIEQMNTTPSAQTQLCEVNQSKNNEKDEGGQYKEGFCEVGLGQQVAGQDQG